MSDEFIEHITDPAIRALYDRDLRRRVGEHGALLEAEKLLPTASDRLAVLEYMQQLLQWILLEFDEHGDGQENVYDADRATFARKAEDVSKRIEAERKAGKVSTVFAEWNRKYWGKPPISSSPASS